MKRGERTESNLMEEQVNAPIAPGSTRTSRPDQHLEDLAEAAFGSPDEVAAAVLCSSSVATTARLRALLSSATPEGALSAMVDGPNAVARALTEAGCRLSVTLVEQWAAECASLVPGQVARDLRARRESVWWPGKATKPGDTIFGELFADDDDRPPILFWQGSLAALGKNNAQWGRFDVRFDTNQPLLRVVAMMMNARSRLTGIATGDQCLFVRRDAFAAAGGFPAMALMEDVALSALLRQQSAPACLRNKVTTSARRWQNGGVWRTIFLMWWLRTAYALGVSPARLARWYGPS